MALPPMKPPPPGVKVSALTGAHGWLAPPTSNTEPPRGDDRLQVIFREAS